MQGTLNEIDIRSILQLIELGQRTGELLVEAYGSHSNNTSGDVTTQGFSFGIPERESKKRKPGPFWFVFFFNGQIAYAANSDASLSRLRDYLRRYKVDRALDELVGVSIASTNAPEYGYLWALLEKHIITPAQGRSILQSMVHETLFDLLSLHNGYFVFEISPALAPQLTSLEIAPLATKIMKQVQEWKEFHPHIQSPHQCPIVTDALQLRETLPENAFKTLSRWADGKTSLRQMARYLNRDLLTVAKAIYPYVQQGWIQLLMASVPEIVNQRQSWELSSPTPARRVICIDDDVAIGKTVEYILQAKGYEVTTIQNPLKALSQVFQIKPDLIVCDLVMPKLDGYELCGMLRQSTIFRLTPIIMLTGRDGFIDRVRARMVGATDYLTKPFGASELLMLLEKYIGPGDVRQANSDSSVTETLSRSREAMDITESASA
ncbi:MAG TPA: response regulator [Cyanobacteria bacterium UBA11149]|nr:response regulator [Cyanobacteria bacterium UBA11367]HBE55993.1 response regulator [Cyanobacteria bacterium UBA11366]HBR77029.1 response regulator [Cyanobacteria bacterium UBA11159]HBS68385.1 response regulator [Cyanobacteria bacterium UBA11153]HBW89017.1 response regulator [Cyanobacteria bacterium UBA11149]HCA94135.1 response regulator [Cyanobacteria bacterium UBA9226]